MLRAQQQIISFPADDSTVTTGAKKSGLVFVASDVKISKDGGTFASATNAPVEIGSTGRYALTLTAAETNCGFLHVYIEKSGMRPQDFYGFAHPAPAAAVVTDAGNTATLFMTNLSSAVNDFYKDALLRFTSGSLAGQVKKISAYNGTTKVVTLASAFTAAPTGGDLFVLVNI